MTPWRPLASTEKAATRWRPSVIDTVDGLAMGTNGAPSIDTHSPAGAGSAGIWSPHSPGWAPAGETRPEPGVGSAADTVTGTGAVYQPLAGAGWAEMVAL